VGSGGRVSLIHETLVRAKGLDDRGRPQGYWPTLWDYVEAHKDRAARRERLKLQAREWAERRGPARLLGLAGWSGLIGLRGLAVPGSLEGRYLRWSLAGMALQALVLTALLGVLGEGVYWARTHGLPLEAIGSLWAHRLGQPLPFPELVRVPPQRVSLPQQFAMGSESGNSSERPVHPVTIARPFYLGATEVTFAQYDAYCEATGRAKPSDAGWSEREKRPAIYVDWNAAPAYAGWLGAMTGSVCRLPSEAEWEYAARAGTTTEYALPAPNGSEDIAGKGLANCNGCGSDWGGRQTAPVGSFPPNAWGLHDMHGNVWEWVEDCWHPSYEGAPDKGGPWLGEDGGNCGGRVLRGGSWVIVRDFARSAFRNWYYPFDRNANVGFRVLCSSPIGDH
jgi:formylglycine-generating enzyme required for sulfatase activity